MLTNSNKQITVCYMFSFLIFSLSTLPQAGEWIISILEIKATLIYMYKKHFIQVQLILFLNENYLQNLILQ